MRHLIDESASESGTDRNCVSLFAFEVFDLLGVGFALCDRSARLLAANRTAEEIIRLRDGLELNSRGVLCVPARCRQLLDKALQQAATAGLGAESDGHDTALIVQRSSGKPSLTLWVHPLTKFSKKAVGTTAPSAVLLLILDSALPVRATEADLYELYGLTPTETRLANLLMDGRTLRDSCRELGVSHSTVRTHLKEIFNKTGVRHQGQLISLLLKSIGLGRMGRDLASSLVPRPRNCVAECMSSLLARESPLDRNVMVVHATSPRPRVIAKGIC